MLLATCEPEVPIVLIQKISPGRFVAVAPVYQMEADAQESQYTPGRDGTSYKIHFERGD